MTKLLIVDDESFIRQGMRTTIPWNDHDIEVVGEASNGKEALRLSIQLRPDIVIADIQMPVMNGLELAKQLNVLLPETKVMILSAYGNTENFTQAIEAKVSRFVLKNANSSDILNSVLEVKRELSESREAYHSNIEINNIYNENQYLIKSTLLTRYITRQLSFHDFTSKVKKLDIDLSGPCYALLLAECSSANDWITINAFTKAFSAFRPFIFFTKDNSLVTLLNTDEKDISSIEMDQLLPELKPYIQINQLVLLNHMETLKELPMAYDSLTNCLDHCYWNTNREYTIITPSYTLHAPKHHNLSQFEKTIISSVLHHTNYDSADASLCDYYEYCKTNLISKTDFTDSVKRLILLLSAVIQDESDMEQLTSSILELETPYEIVESLKSLAKPNSSPKSQMPQIIDALAYINENYGNDLRLEDIANQISLSAGYLSRIFKSETGYSFTEWINRVRIEKAKELISKTDLKYYEIAERVGYKDYKYFAAYFNKFCGCSAKEYKNKYHDS